MPFSYHVCVNPGARFHVKCFETRNFINFHFFEQFFVGSDEWEAHVNCQEAARAHLADTVADGTVATRQAHHHVVDLE